MAETSCYRADCHAMRTIYQAGGFGRIVYSAGEYFHYGPKPLASFKGWRVGCPPLWYPTHSTAYYIGVTGKRYTSVYCVGFRGGFPAYQPGANNYDNEFTDEIALFQTNENGASRKCMCKAIAGLVVERGRVFGERGWMGPDIAARPRTCPTPLDRRFRRVYPVAATADRTGNCPTSS
jgi:hypothetical protein